MTQTRTFLLFAWLMVAALLWMEWNKEKQAPPAPAATAQAAVPSASGTGASAAVPSGTRRSLPEPWPLRFKTQRLFFC